MWKCDENGVQTHIGTFEGAEADDRLGYFFSLSGNGETIVIGDFRHNTETGRVPVYTYDGTAFSWTKVGTVYGDSQDDGFGRPVDISTDGNTVAAGCLRCNSVRIYDTSDGLVKIGDIPGDGADDEFGCNVSLSANGNVIAIASCGTNISQVKVFQKNDQGNWPQYGNTIDGVSDGDVNYLQLSLSSDGQTLAIGSQYDDYLRVFSLVGDDWKQAGPDIEYEDGGREIRLSGDGTTVIACGVGSEGNERGLARVYDYHQV